MREIIRMRLFTRYTRKLEMFTNTGEGLRVLFPARMLDRVAQRTEVAF